MWRVSHKNYWLQTFNATVKTRRILRPNALLSHNNGWNPVSSTHGMLVSARAAASWEHLEHAMLQAAACGSQEVSQPQTQPHLLN